MRGSPLKCEIDAHLDVAVVRVGHVADLQDFMIQRDARRTGSGMPRMSRRLIDVRVDRDAALLRRLAHDAAGQVGVVGGDGVKDVASVAFVPIEPVRDRLDVELAVARAVDVDGLDVRDLLAPSARLGC